TAGNPAHGSFNPWFEKCRLGLSALTAQSHFFALFYGKPPLHLCYIDESGTSSIPGNTSHFVLAGVSIPVWRWSQADSQINAIKAEYDLHNAEIHTAWVLRKYLEQSRIEGFEQLPRNERRAAVTRARTAKLLDLQKQNQGKRYKQKRTMKKPSHTFISLWQSVGTSSTKLRIVSQIGALPVCSPNA
ncbi:MAG: DUF3800 domain-containing protein, partial [Rhodobacteraceae bacterium]|nr:DUF3800 domain-containing protein [Paracoccaceae bacterium]